MTQRTHQRDLEPVMTITAIAQWLKERLGIRYQVIQKQNNKMSQQTSSVTEVLMRAWPTICYEVNQNQNNKKTHQNPFDYWGYCWGENHYFVILLSWRYYCIIGFIVVLFRWFYFLFFVFFFCFSCWESNRWFPHISYAGQIVLMMVLPSRHWAAGWKALDLIYKEFEQVVGRFWCTSGDGTRCLLGFPWLHYHYSKPNARLWCGFQLANLLHCSPCALYPL